MRKILVGVAVTAALVLTGCSAASSAGPATEEEATETLKGKTITLVVPFDPGGGYDAYARMLAPELGEELGATVVVENKPGAGGILATNELINQKPDGTTIALFNGPGHLGAALAQTDGVNYDANAISYIGQISSEPDVVVAAGTNAQISDVSSMNGKRFAATGPGSNEYVDPVVINELLGWNNDIVTGFASSNEASLAVAQGNIELHSRSLGSQQPGIKAGDLKPVLVIGENRGEEGIEGVPTLAESVPADKKELAELHSELVSSGRIIGAPPEVPETTLNVLRDAFETVVSDPSFQKAAEQSGRPVHFTSGEDVQTMVSALMQSPTEYVDLVKKAYTG
ncbi:Bug family tripartite tricarboxylate transporter substrate binding protein [Arthrobacter crystallopoietes]|uniref:Bug family tripartite tricarboxylate transporter substrate binding protein n=1 Tax=Crystallibacter crystallopoietes TaxID=37928 RepID=UPI0011111C47|nr:tripartite tricarboxylate transporter substrate-binding protein [Arthrobacter crystallopoietes]